MSYYNSYISNNGNKEVVRAVVSTVWQQQRFPAGMHIFYHIWARGPKYLAAQWSYSGQRPHWQPFGDYHALQMILVGPPIVFLC